MNIPKYPTDVRELPIWKVQIDPTLQPRAQQSEEAIFRYSLSLARGDLFKPIDVFLVDGNYLLVDGGHRLAAYQLEYRDTIPATIHPGGREKAVIFAASANTKHGVPRSDKDMYRAVENVLRNPETGRWSNNRIAKECQVSHPFVGKVRYQMTCNGFKFDSVRVDANGRKMDTTNIGPKRFSAEPLVTAGVPQPDNRAVQPIQGSNTEIEAAVGDREATSSGEPISTEKIEPQDGSRADKPAKGKRVSISQLEGKIREYENLIFLKDEEIYDLKAQNAYLAKKIKDLKEKYLIIENIEIEEEEPA
jgi:hypothetical protein